MKIRSGFVSNSSSTSFLIVAKEELTEANFLELMGVSAGSPLIGMFRGLFEDMIDRATDRIDFTEKAASLALEEWFNRESLSERIQEKLREAQAAGLIAYMGSLSSDSNLVEQFFCTDSFEVENDKLYLNALECGW